MRSHSCHLHHVSSVHDLCAGKYSPSNGLKGIDIIRRLQACEERRLAGKAWVDALRGMGLAHVLGCGLESISVIKTLRITLRGCKAEDSVTYG